MLTHLSLFSGIGGIDIAAEWAGFETVCFVENNEYCQKVLKKHWPDVAIIGDIKDVTKGKVMAYAEKYGRTRGGKAWARWPRFTDLSTSLSGDCFASLRCKNCQWGEWCDCRCHDDPITLITGGFPCQPFSSAGKRKGKEDDRWLWPEMLRVIREVRPNYVVAENVAGLIRMGLNDCLLDLENEGYSTQTFLIPACAVNAPHRRDRIFIVGYSEKLHQYAGHDKRAESQAQVPEPGDTGSKNNVPDTEQSTSRRGGVTGDSGDSERRETDTQPESLQSQDREAYSGDTQQGSQDVADTNRKRPQGHGGLRERGGQWLTWQGSKPLKGIWESEPPVGRVASRIPARVHRLKALGNAVVPQQIYPILKAIADIELSKGG